MRPGVALLLLVLLAAACGGSADPFRPNLSSISVEPEILGLGLGAVVEYRVEGLTEDGETITDPRSVRWSASDPTVAGVDKNGVATGTGLGQTWIIASSTVSRDSAELNIRICPFGPYPNPIPSGSLLFLPSLWTDLEADSLVTIFGRKGGNVFIHTREEGGQAAFESGRRTVSDGTIDRLAGELKAMGLNICQIIEISGTIAAEIPPAVLNEATIETLRAHPNIALVERA